MSATLHDRITRHPFRWALGLALAFTLGLVSCYVVGQHLLADHQTLHELTQIEFCREQPNHPLCQPGKPTPAAATPSAPPAATTPTGVVPAAPPKTGK